MKVAEWEEMLIRQGRNEEKSNTEKERLRADTEKERADQAEAEVISEKKRADQAEAEVEYLKKQLAAMRSSQ